MNPPTFTKPEILAPAGSLESFFAAMEGGADAVYTGLKEFSARAKAKNFSTTEMERLIAYAHGLGRKVYVTLNTLVKERELPQLVETLGALEAMAVDAVILQDLAVWRLARRHFPGLELHASTQMTVHNAAGVQMLERMGFTRGVLARELSLAEIAALRRTTRLELEHFVHGALCFSFSGQCYFSSWLGGKSGNRGRCAQPCRRRYSYRQQDGYYFSTNDLSAIDLLPDLTAAGVTSFKIEGRMKSAEYVASVVGAYRQVLDAPPAQRGEAVREAKERLKLSFGRLPTKGFLPGTVPTDIAIPSLKGATGRFLGEVSAVHDGTISFKTRDRLHVGDRLRVQPKSDQAGTAFTVKEILLGRRPAMVAQGGTQVSVPSPFRGQFRVGDTVFKVSSEQAFTMSEAACRRKLGTAAAIPTPVNLTVALANATLVISGESAGISLERSYPVETFAASDRPLSAETLRGVFARTADEPFQLAELSAPELPAVVIPPSRLKEVRRDFYRALAQAVATRQKTVQEEHRRQALADLLPALPVRAAASRQVTLAIRDLRDAHILSDPGIDRLLVPLSAANVQGLDHLGRRLRGREEQVLWDLPFIIFDDQWRHFREAVRQLVERGFRSFRLNNLGHFPLFDGLDGLHLSAGYRLFSLNSQALLGWREMGLAEATLYIEDDRENLGELLRRDAGIETALTVYGPVPLITSRIPIRGVRADSPVLSDRGEAYRVDGRSGLTVLTADSDFSLLGHLNELAAMGCGAFAVDLSHVGPFTPRGKHVLEALKQGREVSGTSKFNYETGME
ncbi:MAG TPA: U32 family peptidase [Desulfuromonadales bacterium]|nr:U32 family peptidase [Desulfuromonadales bacterium]